MPTAMPRLARLTSGLAPFYLILVISLAAMLGSLFFSDIAGYLPCKLCWYQRIAMYPLVALSAVALLRRERGAAWYMLPLALIGTVIALWHNIEYYLARFTPIDLDRCGLTGVSCTAPNLQLLGFITIPLLSLVAFIIVDIALFLLLQPERQS